MKEIWISLIGFLTIYVAIKLVKKNRYLQKNAIRTIATVVSTFSYSSRKSDNTHNEKMYRSTVKFETKEKQLVEVEPGDASNIPDPIGSEGKIIYNPEFPQDAKSDNILNRLIAPWLFFGLGVSLFVWGLLEIFSITNVML